MKFYLKNKNVELAKVEIIEKYSLTNILVRIDIFNYSILLSNPKYTLQQQADIVGIFSLISMMPDEIKGDYDHTVTIVRKQLDILKSLLNISLRN